MENNEFWQPFEATVESYDDLHQMILEISEKVSGQSSVLAWRGQVNSEWGLHSKLYRSLRETSLDFTETEFSKFEQKVLTRLRQWGLHSQKIGGRLSVLSQLAMLQHFGTPTRLIDVTFNALVAAFFATERDKDNDDKDARLFAINVSGRLINENKSLRHWEDTLDTPWSGSYLKKSYERYLADRNHIKTPLTLGEFVRAWGQEWSSHFYAWKPPALDARIAAQNGGFIFGGVVGPMLREGYLDTSLPLKDTGRFQIANSCAESRYLSIADTREITSIAITPQNFPQKKLRSDAKNSVYSIKIAGSAKAKIRKKLSSIFGYSHSTIYPDFTGFEKNRDWLN